MVQLMVQPMVQLMVQLMVLLSFFRKSSVLVRRRVSLKTFEYFSFLRDFLRSRRPPGLQLHATV